ncbi:MAG: hypothetical protein JSS01_05795 [Proteobacteria bacterium]|nr:hypothetical protein [Pseudomonadota bacterium]
MAVLLSPAHIALIAQGVSAIVASRSADLHASVMRAMGAQISPDGQHITVFLRASQSAQLLADIAAGGPVAVVFSDPPTNRTLQVKASGARLREARPGDQALLRRYLVAMQHCVGQVGYGPEFVAAMLCAPPNDLLALEFTPETAYDQTPGLRAGTPLPSQP